MFCRQRNLGKSGMHSKPNDSTDAADLAMANRLRERRRHQPEACSAKSARELFSGLLQRIDRGELNPYKKRLTEQQKIAVHKQLIADRGIRYAACSLDSFEVVCSEQRAAVAVMRAFISDLDNRLASTMGGGLVLIGPPGTGKDHLLMAAMTAAILDYGFSVVWRDGLRMYHLLKNAISKNSTEEEIARYVKPQILAISDPLPPRDDLSSYEMACLRDIIDQRYSLGLATWITTNVQSQEEAKQKLTGPLLGRIGHNATEVNCAWPGYRKPLTNNT